MNENGGKFLCGDNLTIADLMLFPFLKGFQKGHIDYVPVTCLDSNKAITDYMHRVANVP